MTQAQTPPPIIVRTRPIYLSTAELAERYGVNEDTARRWCRDKRLPCIKIGTAYRVRLDDLERLERVANDQANPFG